MSLVYDKGWHLTGTARSKLSHPFAAMLSNEDLNRFGKELIPLHTEPRSRLLSLFEDRVWDGDRSSQDEYNQGNTRSQSDTDLSFRCRPGCYSTADGRVGVGPSSSVSSVDVGPPVPARRRVPSESPLRTSGRLSLQET